MASTVPRTWWGAASLGVYRPRMPAHGKRKMLVPKAIESRSCASPSSSLECVLRPPRRALDAMPWSQIGTCVGGGARPITTTPLRAASAGSGSLQGSPSVGTQETHNTAPPPPHPHPHTPPPHHNPTPTPCARSLPVPWSPPLASPPHPPLPPLLPRPPIPSPARPNAPRPTPTSTPTSTTPIESANHNHKRKRRRKKHKLGMRRRCGVSMCLRGCCARSWAACFGMPACSERNGRATPPSNGRRGSLWPRPRPSRPRRPLSSSPLPRRRHPPPPPQFQLRLRRRQQRRRQPRPPPQPPHHQPQPQPQPRPP